MKKVLTILFAVLMVSTAQAETAFILCQPDSYVNVRETPSYHGAECGQFYVGDDFETDGITRNGFLHIINANFECSEAWVFAGFVTYYPVIVERIDGAVEAKGRVACRRSIDGKRRAWLKDGQNVVIYARADDWSITNRGFIQTRYLGGF